MFPINRPRRLRRTEALRALVRETTVTMSDLILPIFVEEGIDAPRPVNSMPGVNRIPEKVLATEIKAIYRDGVKAVMMFGVSHHKDDISSDRSVSSNAYQTLASLERARSSSSPSTAMPSDSWVQPQAMAMNMTRTKALNAEGAMLQGSVAGHSPDTK